MRLGFFGPEGTFTHEALLSSSAARDGELVSLPTIHAAVEAVQRSDVDRALVPIENSLEGSVNATLDALAVEFEDVRIVGEVVHPVHHCLIGRPGTDFDSIDQVVSHPHATAQCASFLRRELPGAALVAATSTAEAVRRVAGGESSWAALGTQAAASLYGCEVLRAGVEDVEGNETRFAWIARADAADAEAVAIGGAGWKTSIVFWGAGDDTPGWLVRCLSELAFRGVNLTLIESRPRRRGLGHYMFFADLEGAEHDDSVRLAIDAVRAQTETLRVLGSYPSARAPVVTS